MWINGCDWRLCNYCDAVCSGMVLSDYGWKWTKITAYKDYLTVKHKCFNCSERIEGWPSVDTVTDMIAFATN